MLGRYNDLIINKVHLKDFTVFNEAEVDFSKGVNVLIGENGTGKTHMMKFMYAVLSGLNLSKTLGFLSGEICDRASDNCILSINDIEIPYSRKNDNGSSVETNNVFIPAKDMLTHAKGLQENFGRKRDMPFDEILLEIIIKARRWKLDEVPELAKPILPILEDIMGGVVYDDGEHFYIDKRNGDRVPFSVEAEGIKKIGLLWQLLSNEGISKKTILFWDEPEANLNPKLVPVVVDIILGLSRQGVQIFLATHDYIFAKYIEVKMNVGDDVMFHALHKTQDGVKVETQNVFTTLENNSITEESIRLYKEELKRAME